jgi:hypothetical protein
MPEGRPPAGEKLEKSKRMKKASNNSRSLLAWFRGATRRQPARE